MTKKELYEACQNLLNGKIDIAQKNIDEAQASANNETKSSAGDKYETGRAMSQRERDLHARQLAELLTIQKSLLAIDADKTCEKVELGAIVETAMSTFFIAGSLGKISVAGKEVMVISAISPIAQAMLDGRKDEEFDWMNKKMKILKLI